jgi:hypothetical protein
MAEISGRRMTTEIDGDFIVFLIGARLDMAQLLASRRQSSRTGICTRPT